MAKKVTGYVKLQIPAGQANPSPPVGPALGAAGLNIMEFCKQFNAETQQDAGMIIPVVITVYQDRSFSFVKKSPPAAVLIIKKANLASGSNNPGTEVAGQVSVKALKEIAEVKLQDMNAYDIDTAVETLAGTARSMGIEVV